MIRKLLVTCAAILALAAGSAGARANAATLPQASTHVAVTPLCGQDYYKNVDGVCVHRPSTNPKGATAKCRDGTYSYSRHASGTCSGHGGVARWIHHP